MIVRAKELALICVADTSFKLVTGFVHSQDQDNGMKTVSVTTIVPRHSHYETPGSCPALSCVFDVETLDYRACLL